MHWLLHNDLNDGWFGFSVIFLDIIVFLSTVFCWFIPILLCCFCPLIAMSWGLRERDADFKTGSKGNTAATMVNYGNLLPYQGVGAAMRNSASTNLNIEADL